VPLPVFKCPICGTVLMRRAENARCSYYGMEDGPGSVGEPAPWRCPNGHFLCVDCRFSKASELPARVVRALNDRDPIALAELLMVHPALRQEAYGPDHHGIPALATLTALRAAGLWEGSDQRIIAAARRSLAPPAGSCFLSGTCGACVGAGAAVSTVLDLDIKDDRRGAALGAVASALGRLAAS